MWPFKKRVNPICRQCVWHKVYCPEKGMRRDVCVHPRHLFTNYVSGAQKAADCEPWNSHGQCPYFEPNDSPSADVAGITQGS